MKKIPVLIIEDNRLLRESLKTVIGKEHDIKLMVACDDIENIPANITEVYKMIVLLELSACNQEGLRTVRAVKKILPDSKIIIMNLIPKQEDILLLVSAGVDGFILKDAAIEDILKTIRIVYEGEKVLPLGLTRMLFSKIIEHGTAEPESSQILDNLTFREKQVIELVAEGLTNKEIALKLHLSCFTVKSHVHNILKKLAVRTRIQIAKIANGQLTS